MAIKKWVFAIMSLSIILILAACGGGTQETGTSSSDNSSGEGSESSEIRERTFSLATTQDDSGIDAEIKEKFGSLIEEKSGGKMNVDFFMSGQLGGETQALEQLKLGELDMGYNAIQADLYYQEYNIGMLPFFFEGIEPAQKLMDGAVGEKIRNAALEKGGVQIMGFHSYGPRWTTSNRPFSTPEEIEGLKIRMPELPWWVESWEGVGALPTPISATEIVTALKTGTVDAQENTLTNIAGRRMWEYQDYLIATKHMELLQTWLISDKTWQSLNSAEQKIIQDSINETIAYITPKVEEMNEEFVKLCEENGMEVIYPDRDAFWEAAKEANKTIIERDLAPGVYEEAIKYVN